MKLVLAMLVGVLATVTGCTGGAKHRAAQTTAAATVRSAHCLDWNLATGGERRQLLQGMRAFFGGQVDSPGARGQVLPDKNAAKLFDAYCAQPYASAFSLYRIYGNAAAFTALKN